MQGRSWLAALVLLATLAVASPAQAGEDRVWTCQLPNGGPAPIRDATSGWQQSLRAGTEFTNLEDRCASGGGIYAYLPAGKKSGDGGMWTFSPPSGTSIGAYSLTW